MCILRTHDLDAELIEQVFRQVDSSMIICQLLLLAEFLLILQALTTPAVLLVVA